MKNFVFISWDFTFKEAVRRGKWGQSPGWKVTEERNIKHIVRRKTKDNKSVYGIQLKEGKAIEMERKPNVFMDKDRKWNV